MAQVINHEFRDMAEQASYPFTAEATMANENMVIVTDCFLDALIYPVQGGEAPYYISAMDGEYGERTQMLVTLSDNTFTELGTAVCDLDVDTVMIHDSNDKVIGVFVYNRPAMVGLISKVGNTIQEFTRTETEFCAGCCFAPAVDGTVYVKTPEETFTGDVVLTAANGMHFELEDEPSSYPSSSSLSSSSSILPAPVPPPIGEPGSEYSSSSVWDNWSSSSSSSSSSTSTSSESTSSQSWTSRSSSSTPSTSSSTQSTSSSPSRSSSSTYVMTTSSTSSVTDSQSSTSTSSTSGSSTSVSSTSKEYSSWSQSSLSSVSDISSSSSNSLPTSSSSTENMFFGDDFEGTLGAWSTYGAPAIVSNPFGPGNVAEIGSGEALYKQFTPRLRGDFSIRFKVLFSDITASKQVFDCHSSSPSNTLISLHGYTDTWRLNYVDYGTFEVDKWYTVEFNNFDFTNETFDFYIDNTLVQASVAFYQTPIDHIFQFYLRGTTANIFYNDVRVYGDAFSSSSSLSSLNSSSSSTSSINSSSSSSSSTGGIYFEDAFEDGNLNKWDTITGPPSLVSNPYGSDTVCSFPIASSIREYFNTTANIDSIRFKFLKASGDTKALYFYLMSSNYVIRMQINPPYNTSVSNGPTSYVNFPAVYDTWYTVEFNNINFTTQTFDFYMDGVLQSSGLSFYSASCTSANQVSFYRTSTGFPTYINDFRLYANPPSSSSTGLSSSTVSTSSSSSSPSSSSSNSSSSNSSSSNSSSSTTSVSSSSSVATKSSSSSTSSINSSSSTVGMTTSTSESSDLSNSSSSSTNSSSTSSSSISSSSSSTASSSSSSSSSSTHALHTSSSSSSSSSSTEGAYWETDFDAGGLSEWGTSGTPVNAVDPYNTANRVLKMTSNGDQVYRSLGSDIIDVYTRFKFRVDNYSAFRFRMRDDSGLVAVHFYGKNGKLYQYTATGLVQITTYSAGQWYTVEFSDFDFSGSEFRVHVNAVDCGLFGFRVTGISSLRQIYIMKTSAGGNLLFDDIRIYGTTADSSSISSSLSSASSHSSSSSTSNTSTTSSEISSTYIPPADGAVLSLNLYGELPKYRTPVKSINNRAMEHCWIAAEPESAIRVVTDTKINIAKAEDFGYAT